MKSIFIYLFVIFFIAIGCKKEAVNSKTKSNVEKLDTVSKVSEKQKELTCYEVINEVVKSSDLDLKDYKDSFIRIEEVKNDSISIQVYFENNLSDNPNDKQIVESTIAWLLFLPNEQKLLNVTADPENPTKVNYKFNHLDEIYKSCNISKKEVKKDLQIIDITKKKDCKNITVEMGKGEECLVKNSTIENVYLNIIKKEEVDDCKYLLHSIPKNKKTIEINKDGLMNIVYNIKKDKIEILFNYDGGVTAVNIDKKNNNVIKRIVYYAD